MNLVSALVPMKGQSERLPKKNVRSFNHKPLFYWVLNSLSHVESIEQIFVDTDNEEIAAAVLNFFPEINIINRPACLCGNHISMNQIIAHDLKVTGKSHFLQTHVTNPLLSAQTITQAINAYFDQLNKGYDSLFSVTEWKKRLYDADRKPLNHDPNKLLNTQDLAPIYEENSNIYLFSNTSFATNNNNRLGKKPYIFPMAPTESIDIDYEHEFMLAELMARIK